MGTLLLRQKSWKASDLVLRDRLLIKVHQKNSKYLTQLEKLLFLQMLKMKIFSVSKEKTISQGCFWVTLLGDVFSACTIRARGKPSNKRCPHMHKGDQRCSLTRWQSLGCSGALTTSTKWRGAPGLLRSYTEVLSLVCVVGNAVVRSFPGLSDFPCKVLLKYKYILWQQCSHASKNTDF